MGTVLLVHVGNDIQHWPKYSTGIHDLKKIIRMQLTLISSQEKCVIRYIREQEGIHIW